MKIVKRPLSRIRHKYFSGPKEIKGYGEIETGWLHYITPRMIITVLALVGLILGNSKVFMEYYHAAIVLNSVIFVTFFIAIFTAIMVNLKVRSAALYLNYMHTVIQHGHPSAKDIETLHARLKTQGRLLNINDMFGAIHNIEKMGFPNFSESNARLIKSKLGFRVAEGRKGVSFLGGLMIMLGLIGTYLGLLETVDTVGSVMQKMSSIGGDAGGDGMSSFISELAEPLQGMALAFSASLFGIAGSVFVSVFNGAAAHAQNDFIENVSRWIDDRIPRHSSLLAQNINIEKLPSEDNLKSWLAAFVNLSLQTNRKMAQMVYVFSKATQTSLKQTEMLQQVLSGQQEAQAALKTMHETVSQQLHAQQTQQAVQQDKADNVLSQLHRDMSEIKHGTQAAAQTLPILSAGLEQVNRVVGQNAEQVMEQLSAQRQDSALMGQILSQFPAVFQQLSANQVNLGQTLQNLPQQVQSSEKLEGDMASIVLQLNVILEELNKQSANSLDELFSDGTAGNFSAYSQAGE